MESKGCNTNENTDSVSDPSDLKICFQTISKDVCGFSGEFNSENINKYLKSSDFKTDFISVINSLKNNKAEDGKSMMEHLNNAVTSEIEKLPSEDIEKLKDSCQKLSEKCSNKPINEIVKEEYVENATAVMKILDLQRF